MDLEIQTIAQRKAARRQQFNQTQAQDTPQAQNPQVDAAPPAQVPAQSQALRASSPSPVLAPLSKEALMTLAQQMGLELREPKKVWIKHSFSITPETKHKFQERCRALGLKMQDALEEVMEDWFTKTDPEFRAITQAKKP